MLAMSSTTIIYKAFDDLGLRQQQFAGLVMSVLILEDILAIVMMVMLSAIASGNNPDGSQMLGSIVKIGFFLVLWLVVGIFAIPIFLRSVRKLKLRFAYAGHRMELDVYPYDQEKAIFFVFGAEPYELPPEIEVIREVTGDPYYKNRAFADRQSL